MTPLNAKPLDGRPKGVRTGGHRAEERRQLLLELQGLACEAIEAGPEWTELDGWQTLWNSAEEARVQMAYALREVSRAFVNRVGQTLYLHAEPKTR
jgi:hypothetical protein